MRRKILAGLLLATLAATAHAQQAAPAGWSQPVGSQQNEVPTVPTQQQFAAIDAWSQHMEDSYYKSLQRSQQHMTCVVNSWHPENCE